MLAMPLFFSTYGGRFGVSGIENRFVRKCEYFVTNALLQLLIIAARDIGAPDTVFENRVADKGQRIGRIIIYNAVLGVSGGVNGL